MIIRDEYLLEKCRNKPVCEWCGQRRSIRLDPHHIFSKGMGGATRLDIKINLISLCRPCHTDVHQGHISRCDLLAVVAAREGLLQADIEQRLRELRRVRQR